MVMIISPIPVYIFSVCVAVHDICFITNFTTCTLDTFFGGTCPSDWSSLRRFRIGIERQRASLSMTYIWMGHTFVHYVHSDRRQNLSFSVHECRLSCPYPAAASSIWATGDSGVLGDASAHKFDSVLNVFYVISRLVQISVVNTF
jgi:hypothetical protein